MVPFLVTFSVIMPLTTDVQCAGDN